MWGCKRNSQFLGLWNKGWRMEKFSFSEENALEPEDWGKFKTYRLGRKGWRNKN